MTPIPPKLRAELSRKKYYKTCARENHLCSGRITWEHAFIYASKQIQEEWSILPLCVFHHLGDGLKKEINQLLCLRRATDHDLAKYPKKDWATLRKYLENKYPDL